MKIPVIIASVASITFLLGFGASQLVDSASTSISVSATGDFCRFNSDCSPGPDDDFCVCLDILACHCDLEGPHDGGTGPGNFTFANLSKETINLTLLTVGLDSDSNIKGTQSYMFPLETSVLPGETFWTAPSLGKIADLPDLTQKFDVQFDGETSEDSPRGDGEPKVKKIKAKKKAKFG